MSITVIDGTGQKTAVIFNQWGSPVRQGFNQVTATISSPFDPPALEPSDAPPPAVEPGILNCIENSDRQIANTKISAHAKLPNKGELALKFRIWGAHGRGGVPEVGWEIQMVENDFIEVFQLSTPMNESTRMEFTCSVCWDPSTRRRPGTGVPVDGPTRPVPVRHETTSHRLSDGSRSRQTGPVAVADGDGSEP
ncbi:hypothetical protein DFH08DRAFT_1049883 [Mycena albidolilacea]|uniref:Uncharacterized protein n=1 Tax=Mycena albidolilacea TaxID=1033008 RepID=A0AAD7EBX8_9AGAR|nr:hypothetical protein DFH08DRAFT_1049883 [Mycena albidolilacea]